MKTVNLQLSRQLKEAGYPQNMDWIYSWYCSEPDCEEKEVQTRDDNYCESCGLVVEGILSPTADEILEQLPAEIQEGELYGLEIQKSPNFYLAQYYDNYGKHSLVSRSAKELSDLLAIMWLYLKENNLLEVKG